MKLSKEQATLIIDELIESYKNQLPNGLTEDERTGLSGKIDSIVGLAKNHIEALYKRGYCLGEKLEGFEENNSRSYWESVKGIERHVETGKYIIRHAEKMVTFPKEIRERRYRHIIESPNVSTFIRDVDD